MRILIADDHEILCNGLSLLLKTEPDMTVVGTAKNGKEAVEKTIELAPDIVIMDIHMPVMDGLTATKLIKKTVPQVEILIFTALDGPDDLRKILDSGASGYLLKTYGDQDLFTAIRSVYNRSPYLYPHAMKHMIRRNRPLLNGLINPPEPSPNPETKPSLTSREQEVLFFITRGYSNREIAEELSISVKTVETFKSKIMNKLQLFSRHALVEYAEKSGYFRDP
ncbi:response regulator transcription factor [Gorillibacterium timonense]|uniref:response regulator transcription factor n=1 Tax=Gorillibacterium timonense TaxID=1689269 RepID=UPI00071C3938|nr:response regulator transcription factor [Gorillibacterium timonense]